MTQVVVIGAGHAGVEFCEAMRDLDLEANITLVEKQSGAPYQRPPLSKDALNPEIGSGLPLRPPHFYQARRINFLNGVAVSSVDRTEKMLSLTDGSTVPYDYLVFATGTSPCPVPLLDEFASVLRTEEDAACIRAALQPKKRIVLVGAGFIGLEIASAASKIGCEVDVVTSGARVLSRAASPEISHALTLRHQAKDIRFHFDCPVTRVSRGENNEYLVHLPQGHILSADAVIVGVGVTPETSLARAAGLEVDEGILVDEFLRTSDPGIFAIGDCAQPPSARLESVQNAVGHARFVAATLAREAAHKYEEVPWFWSVQGKDRLQIAGLAHPDDDRVVVGDAASGPYAVLHFRDDHLAAVETLNSAAEHVAARKVLAGCIPNRHELEAHQFSLKTWQRAAAA